jgi:hypothetical protein
MSVVENSQRVIEWKSMSSDRNEKFTIEKCPRLCSREEIKASRHKINESLLKVVE